MERMIIPLPSGWDRINRAPHPAGETRTLGERMLAADTIAS